MPFTNRDYEHNENAKGIISKIITVNCTAQKRKDKMPPNGKCLAIPVLLVLIIMCEIRTGMVNSWMTGQAVRASNQCMKRLGNYKEHPVVVLGCFPASGSR